MLARLALVLLLGLVGSVHAQPAGSGWQQCVYVEAECTTPAVPGGVYEVVAFTRYSCAEPLGENSYGYGTEGVGMAGYAVPECTPDDGLTYQPDAEASIWWRLRYLSDDPPPDDETCTAALCPSDAIALSWGVVIAWALAWGVRRLLAQAAGADY